jgi:hypothetical protein
MENKKPFRGLIMENKCCAPSHVDLPLDRFEKKVIELLEAILEILDRQK